MAYFMNKNFIVVGIIVLAATVVIFSLLTQSPAGSLSGFYCNPLQNANFNGTTLEVDGQQCLFEKAEFDNKVPYFDQSSSNEYPTISIKEKLSIISDCTVSQKQLFITQNNKLFYCSPKYGI